MINVYGIFKDDACLYVGVTSRPWEVRCKEHSRDLEHNTHDNKTLQKEYLKCNGEGITYRLVDSIDTDNTLLKFFYESLWISFLRPKTNKCIIEQGRNRVILQRCDADIAKKLIDSVNIACS
jgi:hypothetical protein